MSRIPSSVCMSVTKMDKVKNKKQIKEDAGICIAKICRHNILSYGITSLSTVKIHAHKHKETKIQLIATLSL